MSSELMTPAPRFLAVFLVPLSAEEPSQCPLFRLLGIKKNPKQKLADERGKKNLFLQKVLLDVFSKALSSTQKCWRLHKISVPPSFYKPLRRGEELK